MVAVGNTYGEVTIFQIQKDLPDDLLSTEIAASLIQTKPIERYTIRDVYRGAITCVEWSKNGMKLFSGDARGVVVLTEIDFSSHICKSTECLNETYGIVQINFCSPWLVVSTQFRAIVCKPENDGTWKVSQIGRSDRKVLDNFGAVFKAHKDHRKTPSIVCSRPSFRFWLADIEGNVSHTFLLKDSVTEARAIFEVPLLNPVHNKVVDVKDTHFGPCHYYMNTYIVTYCDLMVFVIDLEKLKVVATVKRLRKIQYLAISGSEIFILEGGCSIVRLALSPDRLSSNDVSQNGALKSSQVQNGMKIHIEEEVVVDGDECFELPPIECIELNVPLSCKINEHNLLKEDKLLLEHSRKLEVFEKINTLDYDESILFDTGTKKKKKTFSFDIPQLVKPQQVNGIVEIGRDAESIDKIIHDKAENNIIKTTNAEPHATIDQSNPNFSRKGAFNGLTTKPCLMEASYCDEIGTVKSPTTIEKELKPKEEKLAKLLDIKPISRQPIVIPPEISATPFKPPEFNYPILYPIADIKEKINRKPPVTLLSHEESEDENDEVDVVGAINGIVNGKKETKAGPATVDLPKILKLPNLADIPKLWDIKIEKCDDGQRLTNDGTNENSSGNITNEGSESEWVFL